MRERSEMILADLIQIRAEQKPELEVLTFEHLSLEAGAGPDQIRTYAELQTNANRIAAGMIARGVARGDRLAVMMRNHPEFVETLIACSIAGALVVPVDPRTRGEKLAYMLRNAGCSGAVCADYCLAELGAVRGQLPDLAWILALESGEEAAPLSHSDGARPDGVSPDGLSLDGVSPDGLSLDGVSPDGLSLDGASLDGVEPLAELLSKPAASVDVRAEAGSPLQIMYTSGTTGDPKGIVGDNLRFCAAGMLGGLFGYRPDERPYTGLSLTHGNAQSVTLAPALSMGLRAVFSRRFTKSRLWDLCRNYGCTSFSLVGGMATAIYSQAERPDDGENPVRLVVSGGMPAAIWESFEKRFDLKILEFYGAMDGGGMAYKPVGQGPTGSFGKPLPTVEMKVLDGEGEPCPPGVVGEICTRPVGGDRAVVEYFGNPEASKKKVRRGWNHSGDMGHADEDGWLFFDYRVGGGIRHNGDFVNPGFVEKAIAELPEVGDVFVYGVPAASGAPGEKDVVAAVVCAGSGAPDSDAIFRACREKLESNFVPSYLQVLDEIPKTASEKPQERVLLAAFDASAANVHRERRS